jgi:spore coat-associated protein N
MVRSRTSLSGRQKLALSAALLLLAAGMAALGAYATFTGSASVSHTISSGTVTIALGSTGASTNRLNVNATNIAPGDTIQRSVDLSNTGSLDLSSVTLTTAASPSSLLDSDGTNGLQMVIDRCASAWTESGVSPAFTYSCSGGSTNIVASRAVVGSNVSLPGLSTLSTGGADHLLVTLTLPSAAGNTFQGLSSTISYTFTGTQRAATNK